MDVRCFVAVALDALLQGASGLHTWPQRHSSGLAQCGSGSRHRLAGPLGAGAADRGRAHGFGGLALLGAHVLERRRHLVLLVLLDVGESRSGELAADLLLPYDGSGQGRVLLAGRGDRAVGGEGTVVAG